MNESKYSYDEKVELSEKMSRIKKKEYLAHIFNIITSHNGGKYYGGPVNTILYTHNLTDKAYDELTEYLSIIYNNKSS